VLPLELPQVAPVPLAVAVDADRYAVADHEPQVRVGGPVLDVMGVKFGLAAAVLAPEAVPLASWKWIREHGAQAMR